MRTTQEILGRIETVKPNDFFGIQTGDLIEHLPFNEARQYLKEEFKKEDQRAEWGVEREKKSQEINDEMRDYMEFALGKAENHRGLSAGRSIEHFRAWIWLLGDDELLDFIDKDSSYPNYGVPALRAIGEKYGFPLPVEAEWFINMAEGKKCGGKDGCDEGCA